MRAIILAALTGVFWIGCFAFFTRVLAYFQEIGDFGPLSRSGCSSSSWSRSSPCCC
jgi:hypothetical protein